LQAQLRALRSRIPATRLVEGAAIGVALWCELFVFQLLPGALMDTPGVVIFGIAGALTEIVGFRRGLLAVLILGSATVLIVAETPLSNLVAAHWIREDRFPDSTVGAAVVLSAGLNANGTMSGEGLDHLINGIELVRAGKADLLVTTTIEQRFPGRAVRSTDDQGRLVTLANEGGKWLRTEPGQSTRDEATHTARLLLPRGVRRIAVVASPMHTPRACSSFEAVGFEVTCVPARMRTPGGSSPGPWPADRLKVFGDWVYELAATARYRAAGWLDPSSSARTD